MKRAFTLFFALSLFLSSRAQQTVGLFTHTRASENGYVLFAPLLSKNTYLIDKCGRQLHTWTSTLNPGNSVYLLPSGELLRTGNAMIPQFPNGGVIEKLDWNSNVIWRYSFPGLDQSQHHDVFPMPNGNILALVCKAKTRAEAIAAGRDSGRLGATLWTEKVVELQPNEDGSTTVVWEWDAWDHLVQSRNPGLPNYGIISAHPELMNINDQSAADLNQDWLHPNGIAYNPVLDQIVISVYWTNEFWIIDHATTTAEAASHSGGRHGKGGDILYRWGNPAAYGRGSVADQKLFHLHNAHWIPGGYPDSGKIMVYNNGADRPGGNYSSVEVIETPVDANGDYPIGNVAPFNPRNADWIYRAPNQPDFYSAILSGAERLPGGNTLICDAQKSRFFEVEPSGNVVWDYVQPINLDPLPVKQGDPQVPFQVFRCVQYPEDYPGFAGRTLNPGNPLERNPLNKGCFSDEPVLGVPGSERTELRAVNPFGEGIVVDGFAADGPVRASLYNAVGAVCGRWEKTARTSEALRLDCSKSLPAGTYLLHIVQDGRIANLRLQRL